MSIPRCRAGLRSRRRTAPHVERCEPRTLLSIDLLPPFPLMTSENPGRPQAVDLDGNGQPGLIVHDQNGCLRIHRMTHYGDLVGGGVQAATNITVYAFAAGDFDGNGNADIVTASPYDGLRLHWRDAYGGWNQSQRITGGPDEPWDMLATDLDGDGRLDRVAREYWRGVSTLLNQPDGPSRFVPAERLDVSTLNTEMTAGDLDGDGLPEILLVDRYATTLRILRNLGGGRLEAGPTLELPSRWATGATIADLNGDGRNDIAALSAGDDADNFATVFLNQGALTFSPPLANRLGPERDPEDITAGDLDGDGDLDLAIADRHLGLTLLEARGDGTFAPRVDLPIGSQRHVLIADLNNDARADLLTSAGAYVASSPGIHILYSPPVVVSVYDATIREPMDGEGTFRLSFTVHITPPTSRPVTVTFETVAGTATPGTDFVSRRETVTFTPTGSVAQRVDVTILPDDRVEGNETFYVQLSDAQNARIGRGRAVGTILDTDPPGPRVTSVARRGVHWAPTRLVLSFNAPLRSASATDRSLYRVLHPGRDRRLGTRDDIAIALSGAEYDASASTVALTTARRLPLRGRFRLIVSDRLLGANGARLDGDGDGQPGGDFVTRIDRHSYQPPRR